jgi:hypothetical protein
MSALPRNAEPLVAERRKNRMAVIDALPPDWRELVHEYGFTIVDALQCGGVKKARCAKHIICTILEERDPLRQDRNFSQGNRSPEVTVSDLKPVEPTNAMIAASMSAIDGFIPTLSKREKHRIRLRAAIMALHAEGMNPK